MRLMRLMGWCFSWYSVVWLGWCIFRFNVVSIPYSFMMMQRTTRWTQCLWVNESADDQECYSIRFKNPKGSCRVMRTYRTGTASYNIDGWIYTFIHSLIDWFIPHWYSSVRYRFIPVLGKCFAEKHPKIHHGKINDKRLRIVFCLFWKIKIMSRIDVWNRL